MLLKSIPWIASAVFCMIAVPVGAHTPRACPWSRPA